MSKIKKQKSHWIFDKAGNVRFIISPVTVARTQTGKIPANVGHSMNLSAHPLDLPGYSYSQQLIDEAKMEENRRAKDGLAGWKQQ